MGTAFEIIFNQLINEKWTALRSWAPIFGWLLLFTPTRKQENPASIRVGMKFFGDQNIVFLYDSIEYWWSWGAPVGRALSICQRSLGIYLPANLWRALRICRCALGFICRRACDAPLAFAARRKRALGIYLPARSWRALIICRRA